MVMVRICCRPSTVEALYMIINYIFHKINSSKSHPYLYLSPHVYGFGNLYGEEIHLGLIRAKYKNKKLVILYPFDIPFIFKYKLTNRALFNIKSDLIVDQGKYTLMLSRVAHDYYLHASQGCGTYAA